MDLVFSPPPQRLQALMALHEQPRGPTAVLSSPTGDAISPSLVVIAAIVVFVFVVSASIHLLLRYLSHQSSSSSAGSSSPLVLLRLSSSSAPAAIASPTSPPAPRRNFEEEDLIESLPLFTLASALSTVPKSSLDCAVCLSSFHQHDQLRLLPHCHHAFHSTCIDTWLRSSLSCPLCRSPIVQDSTPPLPGRSQLPPAPRVAPSAAPVSRSDSSGSYRVEIGSVSRRATLGSNFPELPPQVRSYSLGSSFHYVVEEEVEAMVANVAVRPQPKDDNKDTPSAPPPSPGENVAGAVGWGGGSRSWLRDYVDRLASSASSSFSSLRLGGCGSRRFDCGDSWDREPGDGRPWQIQVDEEDDGGAGVYHSFYRWLIGA